MVKKSLAIRSMTSTGTQLRRRISVHCPSISEDRDAPHLGRQPGVADGDEVGRVSGRSGCIRRRRAAPRARDCPGRPGPRSRWRGCRRGARRGSRSHSGRSPSRAGPARRPPGPPSRPTTASSRSESRSVHDPATRDGPDCLASTRLMVPAPEKDDVPLRFLRSPSAEGRGFRRRAGRIPRARRPAACAPRATSWGGCRSSRASGVVRRAWHAVDVEGGLRQGVPQRMRTAAWASTWVLIRLCIPGTPVTPRDGPSIPLRSRVSRPSGRTRTPEVLPPE